MYNPFAALQAWKPVAIGGDFAIPAAVNAAKHTGGVTLLSWLNQKMIRWAISKNPVKYSTSTKTGLRVMATSKGIAATKLQASSSDIPVATFAT